MTSAVDLAHIAVLEFVAAVADTLPVGFGVGAVAEDVVSQKIVPAVGFHSTRGVADAGISGYTVAAAAGIVVHQTAPHRFPGRHIHNLHNLHTHHRRHH